MFLVGNVRTQNENGVSTLVPHDALKSLSGNQGNEQKCERLSPLPEKSTKSLK
jgi:hypothetical protein